MDPNQQQPTPTPPTDQPTPPQPTPPLPGAIPTQPVTPAPEEAHDYTHPIAEPPKHVYHPKRFVIGLSIFVAACIVAVGVMLLLSLLPGNTSKKATTDNTSKKQATESLVPAELAINHVKEYFKGTKTAKSALLLPVQAPDVAYYTVIPDIAPLISVADAVAADKADAQLTSITHSLEGDDFKANVISDGSNNTNYQAYFTRSDTICEADLTRGKAATDDAWIEAKCLDMSTYSAYAQDQSTFANAYPQLTSGSVQYGFVGKPTITKGTDSGYQRGKIQVSSVLDNKMTTSGKYALYYQTPDGLWYYFTDQDANVLVSCTLYKTDYLRHTYGNLKCVDPRSGETDIVKAMNK